MRVFLKKKYFKRRILRKHLKIILYRYKQIIHRYLTLVKDNLRYYTNMFFVTLPQRQQHFTFFNLESNKQYHLSSGQILNVFGRRAKYFRKHPKNIAALILQLKNAHYNDLNRLYLLKLKNFNYRQYLFFNKFIEAIKPNICFFFHKKSFLNKVSPRRRIKRKYLKKINCQ